MSKTVDERVVEMRFDNSNFEKNVNTSMSTIAKLKEKLNLTGASKGLDKLNTTIKNTDMSGIGNAVDKVHGKFSAFEVMAVTALANITNSAVNTGKRIVSALTIDPIKSGLEEYETQINAVQTILANTESKGSTLNDVNEALNELNKYADLTIYNFTEMTRNIGTFTAAGVDLNTSVNAIKGIANLAAVSGSTSQQASTAMYQLSQALASGKVQLQDWNSVVNAGMGGEVFQTALKRTATVMGKNVDALIKKYGSFRESLTQGGWMTTEVLTETLNQFAGAYSKAELIQKGYTKEQATEITKMAKTATDAATKVKTFTQLVDTVKEAAQSGWTQSWQILIGDFEQAKSLWSGVSDVLGDMINNSANNRNNLLTKAFSSSWDQLTAKVNKAGITTEQFQNRVKQLAKNHNVDLDKMTKKYGTFENALRKAFSSGKLDKSIIKDTFKSFIGDIGNANKSVQNSAELMKKYGKVVDKVINGGFGHGEDRIKRLTKAGYDYATIQNLVNEKLGSSVRHTSKLTSEQLKNVDSLSKMSNKQLKAQGLTNKQIKSLRKLAKAANESGTSINNLINNIERPSGRELVFFSISNVFGSVVKSCNAIKKAWNEAFHPNMTANQIIQERADRIYNILNAINSLTEAIKVDKDAANQITRTFKGLFALLNIVTTITSGGLTLAFKAVSGVLKAFDMDILEATALVGDALVTFKEFVFNNDLINSGFELLGEGILITVNAIKDLVIAFSQMPKVQEFINNIKNVDFREIGHNVLEGLKNGLKDGITSIPSMLIELGKAMIDSIKNILGIHSPSTVMYEIGVNCIQGLINGLKEFGPKVIDFLKNLIVDIKDTFSDLTWDKVFAIGVSVGFLALFKKIVDAFDVLNSLGGVFDGVSDILENAAKVVGSFGKVLKAVSFNIKMDGIKKLAESLLILVAAIAILSLLDTEKCWHAVGQVAALAAILAVLAVSMDLISKSSISIGRDGVKADGLKAGLMAIGSALLLLAITVKILGSLKPGQAVQGFIGLVGLIGALSLVFIAYGQMVKGSSAKYADRAGKLIAKLSTSLLLLVVVVKLVSMLSPGEMVKGVVFMTMFGLFTTALIAATRLAGEGEIDRIGKMMTRLSMSMLLLVAVVKLVSGLSPGEMAKGTIFAIGFAGFVSALLAITKIAGNEVPKIGSMLLAMSSSMLILAIVAKIIATMDFGDMAKAIIGIAGLTTVMYMLVKMVQSVGSDAPKIGLTLLAMSASIGILAMVCVALGLIRPSMLAKGIIAVGMLGIVMSEMIKATKDASDCKSNLIVMTAAIGIMAIAVAALSMIDTKKLIVATTAMSTLMYVFSLIIKASRGATNALPSLIAITATIGLLGGLIYLLSSLPIESVIGVSASLAVLLTSLSGSLAILNKVSTIFPKALISIGAMTLVVVALSGIIYALQDLNPQNGLAIAGSLSLLLISLTASCAVLAVVGLAGPAALIGIASMMALIVGIGGMMVGLGALCNYIPKAEEFLDKGLGILQKIAYGIGSFFGNIIVGFNNALLSTLPTLGTSLSDFMTNLQPFFNVINKVDDSIPKKVGLLSAAILALTGADIIESITSFFTGGDSFAKLGASLSEFANNAQPFFDIVSKVDPAIMTGVNSLAQAVSTLTTSRLKDSIVSFITGGNTFEEFGSQLQSFGKAITLFSDTVKGKVDDEAVKAAASSGEMLASLQSSLSNSGGVVQWFTGEKDFVSFSSQLVSFGKAIVGFSKIVKGKVDDEAVKSAADAGKLMSELQTDLTGSGGVVQWFTGEKDFVNFGNQLQAFGKSIIKFSSTVAGNVDAKSVKSAANAGELLSELQNNLVNTGAGGIVTFFNGEKDFVSFGNQITAFGNAIVQFSNTVAGNVNETAIQAATNAGEIMNNLQNALPSDTWFDGKMTISDFGTKIISFGKSIANYALSVSNIDTTAISTSITQANRLVYLTKSVTDLDTSGIKNFEKVKDIGTCVKKYSDELSNVNTSNISSSVSSAIKLKNLVNSLSTLKTSGINNFEKVKDIGITMRSYSQSISGFNSGSVTSSILAAFKLKNLISSLSSTNTNGIDSFVNSVNRLGKVNIGAIVSSFSGASSKLSTVGGSLITSLVKGISSKTVLVVTSTTKIILLSLKSITSKNREFQSSGATLTSKLASGISSRKGAVISAIRSAVSSASSTIRAYYGSFHSSGSYLASGFANGISSSSYKASVAARAMANAAKTAAQNALDIHSPSRVFYKIGQHVVNGFTKALYT